MNLPVTSVTMKIYVKGRSSSGTSTPTKGLFGSILGNSNKYGNDSFNYVQACLFFIEDIALQVNFVTVELLINEMSI